MEALSDFPPEVVEGVFVADGVFEPEFCVVVGVSVVEGAGAGAGGLSCRGTTAYRSAATEFRHIKRRVRMHIKECKVRIAAAG